MSVAEASAELEAVLEGERVVRVPTLVRGRLVHAPRLPLERLRAAAAAREEAGRAARRFALDGVQVIRQPVLDRATLAPTGEDQFLLLPAVAPEEVVETDPGELARGLFALPFAEVAAYVGALAGALRELTGVVERIGAYAKAPLSAHAAPLELTLAMLPSLLDPTALRDAVDRELGDGDARGTRYLDGWAPVAAGDHRGLTARLAEEIIAVGPERAPRLVRAMPTRQLHVTAGSSPVVPFVSALRAFATKGAAVIKSPADATAPAAMLAAAMRAVDPGHPLTRHTSLVYWPGGDRGVEDALLRPGAFDRVVVWGSAETIADVRARAPAARLVLLEPRVGLSLVGREALAAGPEAAAARAVADSMIADQQACTASLVHYVEATDAEAIGYCAAVRAALARWDCALPHVPDRSSLAALARLRRGILARARWFENGRGREITSAVALAPGEFDLSAHPMSRLVVVRRVDDLRAALAYVHAGVSTVGVAPEARRAELRDELAARGVSHVRPLGEAERAYPGMPHDGMRVLSELVSWVTA